MTAPIESMAEWIDRQPWPDNVKSHAHAIGDRSSMGRALWREWLDRNYPGLSLAPRVTQGDEDRHGRILDTLSTTARAVADTYRDRDPGQ